ncbi:hypothetical protein [Saccharothrix xinjiangensis]|uniref:Polyketide synthase dehydratase domain-containing protein n=1 Tax=Saccharothrix xinjiangensis TaxID=204798 RepID=A0ABV9Y0J8_9PSEU
MVNGVPATPEPHRGTVVAAHRLLVDRASEAHRAFLRGREQAHRLLRAAALGTSCGPAPAPRPGAVFVRGQLEHLATGRLSEVLGPEFAACDGMLRPTRLPAPPLLLVDRVTALDAPRAELGTGSIRTETDVRVDSDYLDPAGRVQAGSLTEAAQADLLLFSWMGIDLLVGDGRVYRLLGCELTFHGELPVPGDTLRYDIHVDGHAEHRGVRLASFHYDCHVGPELRLSMRDGRAGFFTDAELATAGGIRWDPAADQPEQAPVDPAAISGAPRSYDRAAVRAFAAGDPAACFGPAWRACRSHVRTPRLPAGRMLLLHEVEEFAPAGGPWGRGYLRARTAIGEDDWYFAAHFLNDPCMPGTMMLEGGLQAMAFHLAALGHTADRDGWRFAPEPGRPVTMRCRGQVTPRSRELVHEVFVVSVVAGPLPTLVADVLCSVDGVPAFHLSRVALRLVPDWPLEHWSSLGPVREQATGEPVPHAELGGLLGHPEDPRAVVLDGVAMDRRALLASAWGRPSTAFGPRFAEFDGARRCPRLPGPPYLFLSRVVEVDGPFPGTRVGSRATVEYDVPDRAWYFEQNTGPVMPFAVLAEVALQPCGWLGNHVGSALGRGGELLFRNLDGDGVVLGRVGPRVRVLRTEVELLSDSEHEGMVIQSFAVRCSADGVPVFVLRTTCGFFPPSAFADQAGLPASDADRERLAEPGGPAAAADAPRPAGCPPPPGPMLRALDRVTGYWPRGGPAGLGRLRAESDVDPDHWVFKSHFFQDPVQPGSLGMEAVCQLLQHYLVASGRLAGLPGARFEPILTGRPVTWKYRGQVAPGNRLVTVELDITEAGEDDFGAYAVGEAWLWVDGKRVYHLPRIGTRALPGPVAEEVFDPGVERWTADHRPTWTAPVLPFMSVVDLLARAAARHTGAPVRRVRDVHLRRWLVVDEPLRVRTEVTSLEGGCAVALSAGPAGGSPPPGPAATGLVEVGGAVGERPPPFPPLPDAHPEPDLYESGDLFHGPAFHYLVESRAGAAGASGTLDAGAGGVPRGSLHQGLLDGALHVVPHQSLWRWSPLIGRDRISVPHRLVELRVFEPLPDTGAVGVEARFAGFHDDNHLLPVVDVQLVVEDRVALDLRMVLVLLPLGRLGALTPAERRAFVGYRSLVGAGLSATADGCTTLRAAEVAAVDWLPGTVAAMYGLPESADLADRPAEIAVKEHVGRLAGVHPADVVVDADLRAAHPLDRTRQRYEVQVERHAGTVSVRTVNQ